MKSINSKERRTKITITLPEIRQEISYEPTILVMKSICYACKLSNFKSSSLLQPRISKLSFLSFAKSTKSKNESIFLPSAPPKKPQSREIPGTQPPIYLQDNYTWMMEKNSLDLKQHLKNEKK